MSPGAPARGPEPEPFHHSVIWQTLDRVVLGSVGFAVSVLVSRWIGVEASGQLAGAYAIIALAGALTTLGLESSVPRVLIEKRLEDAEILASALAIRRIAGATMLLATGAAGALLMDDGHYLLLILLLGLAWLVPGGEVIELYWITRGQAGSYLPGKFIALAAGRLSKLAAAYQSHQALPVAAVHVLEPLLNEIAQRRLLMTRSIGGSFRASRRACRALLARNLPLVLATLAVVGYHRLDQLMILSLRGASDAGHYAAAVQIYELGFAAIMILMRAGTGRLTAATHGADLGHGELLIQLRRIALFGWASGLVLWLGADRIVVLLYGAEFVGAAEPLRWLGLTTVWVGFGTVSGVWLVAHGHERLALQRTLFGLGTNVLLNLALIPSQGPAGAAIATLLSQIVVCWLFDLLHAPVRRLFSVKLQALATPLAIRRS